jgi:saccharopine dehydrogenase-like NADP-dependent oxidoreductase
MHIIVLGGAGAMGRVTVRALSEYTDVDQITIADYNEGRAREVAASLKSSESSRSSRSSGSSRIAVKQIDVNDAERLAQLVRGADVVLSAVEYVFNLPILNSTLYNLGKRTRHESLMR